MWCWLLCIKWQESGQIINPNPNTVHKSYSRAHYTRIFYSCTVTPIGNSNQDHWFILRLWMQARIKKELLFLSELTICQSPLWLPGMVLAQRRQSLAFWQEREWSLWRCAAAGAAVKYGYALKGMEGHRREGGKGGGEEAWQWRCVRSLRKEKVRKLGERYLGSDFNFVPFFSVCSTEFCATLTPFISQFIYITVY